MLALCSDDPTHCVRSVVPFAVRSSVGLSEITYQAPDECNCTLIVYSFLNLVISLVCKPNKKESLKKGKKKIASTGHHVRAQVFESGWGGGEEIKRSLRDICCSHVLEKGPDVEKGPDEEGGQERSG